MINGFVKTLFNVIKEGAKKHANLIFGIVGVVGVAGTAVCSTIATKNAMELLQEHENENLTNKEKIALVWPEYIWTAIVGFGTCGSIIASNIISAKKAAALTAALLITKEQCATTRAVLEDYRQATIKYLPQDPEEMKKIQKIIDKRPVLEDGQKTKYIRDHLGDILHIHELDTGLEYDCRLIDLDAGVNAANAIINEQGFCPLNSFHELIPNTDIHYPEIGWDIGWDGQYQGLIGYTHDEHLEQGPNGEGIVIVDIVFNKAPEPKAR